MRVFGTACACGVSDDSMKYGRVNADGVLPSHEIVNNLQHQSIKGGPMVKPKYVALDLSSNAMYITKRSAGFEPPILFGTASPYDCHVVN